jgi:hypothetical protein
LRTRLAGPNTRRQCLGHCGASTVSKGNKISNKRSRTCQADLLCTTYSISASAYLQPSLVRAPTIPRRFVDNGSIDPAVTGHRASEPEPQLSAYVLSATCDLSEKLYEMMLEYGRPGVDTRIRLYQELREWGSNMPSLIRADANFCPETSLLR